MDLKQEEVGFEPTVRSSRTTVFKTAPINRSGTPPENFIYDKFIFIIIGFKCKDYIFTNSLTSFRLNFLVVVFGKGSL